MVRTRWGATAAAVAVAVLVGAGPVGAIEGPADPDPVSGPDVVDVLDEVEGLAGGTAAAVDPRTGEAAIDGGEVELPVAGEDLLVIEPVDGPAIGLSLPTQGDATIDDRGSVLDATTPDASVVARPSEDGVQALVVIDSAHASERYSFDVTVGGEPARLEAAVGGGVTIRDASESEVGMVQAPWATDATGATVPTRYEIDGSTIVQIVEHHDGATYPVVADPNTCGIATCTYYFGKQATRDISHVDKATALCRVLRAIPLATVGCVVVFVGVHAQAVRARDRGMCLKIKYTKSWPVVWYPDIYSGKHCR